MTQNHPRDWNTTLSKLTAWLVGFLAVASFVLSYDALLTIAKDAGINGWLAYLWPLTLDAFVIVVSLVILGKSLKDQGHKLAWLLVVIFTALSIFFNAVHKGVPIAWYNDNLAPYLPMVVYVLPPVALVLSFHLLTEWIAERVRRDNVTEPAAIVTVTTPAVTVKAEPVTRLTPASDIPAAKAPVTTVTRAPGDKMTVTERQARVLELARQNMKAPQIADTLGVAHRTVYRDLDKLNGKVTE